MKKRTGVLFLVVLCLFFATALVVKAKEQKAVPQPLLKEKRAPKKIALTFDDGPNREYTPAILKILEEEDVKATFFVVGWRVYEFQDIIRTMGQNGHEIGNHSYDHPYLTELPEKEIHNQLQMTNYAVLKFAGQRVLFCRPPYGSYNETVKKKAAELGLRLVLWSVNPEDWRSPGKDIIQKRILDEARDGSVVLLHDKLQTVQMLPELIKSLKERQFELVTLSELYAN